MAIIDLQDGALSARVSTAGGVLLDFSWMRDGRKIPLLRPAADDADALSVGLLSARALRQSREEQSASVSKDATTAFSRTRPGTHTTSMEMAGWPTGRFFPRVPQRLRSVSATGRTVRPIVIRRSRASDCRAEGLKLHMSVENTGEAALPFGLGWHPFFPLTEQHDASCQGTALLDRDGGLAARRTGRDPCRSRFLAARAPAAALDQQRLRGLER